MKLTKKTTDNLFWTNILLFAVWLVFSCVILLTSYVFLKRGYDISMTRAVNVSGLGVLFVVLFILLNWHKKNSRSADFTNQRKAKNLKSYLQEIAEENIFDNSQDMGIWTVKCIKIIRGELENNTPDGIIRDLVMNSKYEIGLCNETTNFTVRGTIVPLASVYKRFNEILENKISYLFPNVIDESLCYFQENPDEVLSGVKCQHQDFLRFVKEGSVIKIKGVRDGSFILITSLSGGGLEDRHELVFYPSVFFERLIVFLE